MKRGGLYVLFLALVLALVFVSYSYSPWLREVLLSPDNPVGTCIDSDYGTYPSLAGIVESDNYNYGEMIEVADVCFNETLVVEYSCDADSTYRFQTFVCKTGCLDGACLVDREAHLLDTYIDVDQEGEFVEVRRDTGDEWIVQCPKVREGGSCTISDIGLTVSGIYVDEPDGDRWATFSYGQGGRPFRDIFDSLDNGLVLPLLSDFPKSSYTFRITDVDNPATETPIQNVTFSYQDGLIVSDYSSILEGKNHNFDFDVLGDAVRLITQSAEGEDVMLSLLYGDGENFLGMYALDTGGGKLVTSNDNDLVFNLTNKDGHFIVSQAAGGIAGEPNCDASIFSNISECKEGDLREIYYSVSDSCADIPGNITYDRCDFDDNGVIGNEDDIDSNFDVEVYVDGDRFNSTESYSGVQEVEFDDNGDLRVSFDVDFDDEVLDLTQIYVRSGEEDDNGYIIVNGLDFEKTVYIERLNDDSNAVCIEDREITSINSISSSCSSTSEYLVLCDGGDYSNYTCEVSGDYYKVSGLMNSGVLEYEENSVDNCSPSWSCGDWGSCVNGEETRFCTDANSCGTSAGKPQETRSCTVSGGGQTCSELGGEKCFADEVCSVSVVSASDGSCCLGVCQEESSNSSSVYFWIVFAILVVAILVVGIMIFLSLKNKSLEKSLKRFSS